MAREEEISEKEIGAVQGICMAVAAGQVNAQLKEVESRAGKNQV